MHPIFGRTWRATPRIVQDSAAMAMDRLSGLGSPEPPMPRDTRYRVFFGPVNYAGQAAAWSQALERNPDISARTMVTAENNPFGYPVDHSPRWRTWEHDRTWHRAMLDTLSRHYTHVVFEAVMPVLGGRHGGDVLRQIAELRKRGLEVAILGHGTDVRLPSRHRALEPWSHYRDDEWTPFDAVEEVTRKNLAVVTAAQAPTFVSTPGLLLDIPSAHLVPIVIDVDRWTSDTEPLERAIPRVMHSPSNPVTKGTDLILPAVQRLVDEGLIEYVRIQGVPNDRMPAFFAEGDILLDQFRAGDYGVAATDAMASGRLVVSHVSDQVRETVRDLSGLDLPIVEANPDTLEQVLRDVLARRDHYRRVAAEGPGFVRAVHDGTLSRTVFERHLLRIR